MVLLSLVCFFIANVVEAGNTGLSAQFVDQLALPEKHNVLLRLFSFFLQKKGETAASKNRLF